MRPRAFEAAFRKALEYEISGHGEDAYGGYNEAFGQAARQSDGDGVVRCLLGSARALQICGRNDAADEVALLALEIARINGLARATARALNEIGILHHEMERWDEARNCYDEALELARDDGDDDLIAAVCPNLGAIANAVGDLREARALYLEGIGASVRSSSGMAAGTAYNNLGMVCADLEEWTEAQIHFQRGVEIAERAGNLDLLARLLTGGAEPLIRTREFAAAQDSLKRAETLGRNLGNHKVLADLERFRGLMARMMGDPAVAEMHLANAISIATEAQLELERAEALEEIARLRKEQKRYGAGLVLAREAERAYRLLGAHQDLKRIEQLRRDLAKGD